MVTGILKCGSDSTCGSQDGFELAVESLQNVLYKVVSQQKTTSIAFKSTRYLHAIPTQMYRDEFSTAISITQPINSARWRDRRRVLAPLNMKQNGDNNETFTVNSNGKRKGDFEDTVIPSKRIKLQRSSLRVLDQDNSDEAYLFQKYDCRDSYIKLYDVFQEIPVVKEETKPINQNDFAELLGLFNPDATLKPAPSWKNNNSFRLNNYTNVPFSSDYGQRLQLKRQGFTEESALKKLERIEWYLKDWPEQKNCNNAVEYETAYEKKSFSESTHFYRFPKRQARQNHESLAQSFSRYACKPARVHLDNLVMDSYLSTNQTKEQSKPQRIEEEELQQDSTKNQNRRMSPCVVMLTRMSVQTNNDESKQPTLKDDDLTTFRVDGEDSIVNVNCAILREKKSHPHFNNNNTSLMPHFENVINKCTNVFGEKGQTFNYLNLQYFNS